FSATLDGKELDILENRLLSENPHTLQAMGEKYGITKERVRQLEERLKKKIRSYIEEQIPDLP
ncbi:MAG: RNA polymerase subunit sigma-70, partial [Proteobacteria bacterium]|nr:RNA polymerase subunit sigma-70 [Pseudomonadota bacterium]